MFKYTKYLTNNIFIGATVIGFILGGHWMWLGFVFAIVGGVGGDFLLGDHGEAPEYTYPQILNLIMYSYFPVIACAAVVFIWTMVPNDLFGIGAAVASISGYDALAARVGNHFFDLLGGALGLGLMLAITNVIMAHELIHRTWNPISMFFGRWFFAMSGGIPFEVEHVYGHHTTLGQPHDASLSLRGDSYWTFYSSAPIKQIVYAWGVEKDRLAKHGHSVYWIGNKMIRSTLRIGVVWSIVYSLGGWIAVGMYTVAFGMSKMMYEAIGYQFHHGQVCAPGEPDGDRHSWNCNRLMSQMILFNVSKHSEHHKHPNRPFHELAKVKPGQSPILKTGCVTNAFLAYFPPIFRRVVGPQVLQWDREFATETEKNIATEQNAASGLPVYT
ncbi:MAG: fatty acid desaturase [Gammaproteobacteria bacterium]